MLPNVSTDFAQYTADAAPGPRVWLPRRDRRGVTAHLVRRRDVVRGLSVHAWDTRDPPAGPVPVVVLHGQVVSGVYMLPMAWRLARHTRVLVPELPGQGLSDTPRRALTVAERADVLRGWLDAVGLDQVDLVANSVGCQVVTALAVDAPERVRRLVLQGPTFDAAARSFPVQALRWVADIPLEPRAPLLLMTRDLVVSGLGMAVGITRRSLEDRIETRLPRVQAPTLVVRGSRDPIVPRRWFEEVVRSLPNGRGVEVPHAAHVMGYSSPVRFADLVRDFLGLD